MTCIPSFPTAWSATAAYPSTLQLRQLRYREVEQGLMTRVLVSACMCLAANSLALSGIGISHRGFGGAMPRASVKPNRPSITCWFFFASIRSVVNNHWKSRARARSKPRPDRTGNQPARRAGAEGNLHVQQEVEGPALHLPAQVTVGPPATRLVQDVEGNARNVTDQRGFELSDDPGDVRGRPMVLKGPYDRYGVTDVPHRRQPEDADALGFGW